MAIIERKQLTGTTQQINAYAGHQGQLAFDKTTKHLHVLSGTAGTTTKLANVSDIPAPVDISGKADKTYVDTELAGKANVSDIPDASKYLPLSGGNLEGCLSFRDLSTIDANTDLNYKGLELRSAKTWEGGAAIYLRSNKAAGERERGSWGIASKDANGVDHLLQGIENRLYYEGAEVERNISTSTFSLLSGSSAVERRFSSSLMLISGKLSLIKGGSETITFKTPFASNDYAVSVMYNTTNGVQITSAKNTSITFKTLGSDSGANFHFIIMGSWK